MLAPTQSPSFAFFPKQPVMTKTKTSTMVKSVLTSSLPSSTLKRPPPTLVSITPNPAKKRKVVASTHRSSSTAIVVKPTPPPPASRSPTAVRDDDTSSEDEIDYTFSRKRSTPIPSDTDPVSFPFASRETWSVLRSPFTCAARAHADERCISSEDVVREVITKYKTCECFLTVAHRVLFLFTPTRVQTFVILTTTMTPPLTIIPPTILS
ncbi:hypothetical protein FRC02_009441 [Tulasnella sp. 418]|nr:hypothetical protein FRC02_009441 [Tulasnella sp. 418]